MNWGKIYGEKRRGEKCLAGKFVCGEKCRGENCLGKNVVGKIVSWGKMLQSRCMCVTLISKFALCHTTAWDASNWSNFQDPKQIPLTGSKFHSTILQKLSKCEVNAWLCWYLIILPPLQFHVKSNFGEFKRSKNVIFGNFGDSELEFW